METYNAELVEKIRTLGKSERFKLDAFFFCGFPTDSPNEALMYACDAYCACADQNRKDPAVTEKLIVELEKAQKAAPEVKENLNVLGGTAEIDEILSQKELL